MIHALRSLTTIETLFGYNISFGDKSNTNWTVDSVNWKGLWISQLKKKNKLFIAWMPILSYACVWKKLYSKQYIILKWYFVLHYWGNKYIKNQIEPNCMSLW